MRAFVRASLHYHSVELKGKAKEIKVKRYEENKEPKWNEEKGKGCTLSLCFTLFFALFILFFILIILQLGFSLQDLTSNFRSYFVLFSYILDYLCHYIISGRTTLYLRLIIQVIIFTFRIFDFTFVIRELGSYCWVFIFPLALYRLIFIIPGSCCWFLLEYTIIIFWLLVVALFLFLFPYHYIINYIYIFVLFSFLLFIIWFLISLHFIAKKPNIKRKKENKRTKMWVLVYTVNLFCSFCSFSMEWWKNEARNEQKNKDKAV